MAKDAPIRVGIGGWDYDPWRGTWFPDKLAKTKQLEWASRRLTTIEINATYYRSMKPELFRKWADMVPDDFSFAVKASRFCTNRRVLADAAESVGKFLDQGITELGPKLGPILWQFMATKKFDREDFAGFLKLLPAERDGLRLYHALEVRHESFADPAFFDLARDANAAIVLADSADYPVIDEATADFAYARLLQAREEEPAGYPAKAISAWAERVKEWKRPSWVYFINGAKVRAPHAAEVLIAAL